MLLYVVIQNKVFGSGKVKPGSTLCHALNVPASGILNLGVPINKGISASTEKCEAVFCIMSFAIGAVLMIIGLYLIGRNHEIAVRLGVAGRHPSDWHLRTSVGRQNVATIGILIAAAGLAMIFLF